MRLRKTLSIILAVCMILSSVSAAYAEDIPEITETKIEMSGENVTEDQTAEVKEEAETAVETESAETIAEESAGAEAESTETVEDKTETETAEDIVLTAELDDVVITLKAASDAFENKGELSLDVKTVEIEDTEDEKALDAVEKENVAKRVTYDITVLDDGEVIEPVKEVKVSFELKNAPSGADGVNIYHHDEEDGIEKIATEEINEGAVQSAANIGAANTDENSERDDETTEISEEELAEMDDVEIENDLTIEATTDSFSLYTVDFTYKGKTVSIDGDTTGSRLDDIMSQLGIEEKVEEATAYQDAECTEEVAGGEVREGGKTLFSVYEIGDIWYVDAVSSFETEHGLIVKTSDGAEYKIKVTDPAPLPEYTWTSVSNKDNCLFTFTDNAMTKETAEVIANIEITSPQYGDCVVYAKDGTSYVYQTIDWYDNVWNLNNKSLAGVLNTLNYNNRKLCIIGTASAPVLTKITSNTTAITPDGTVSYVYDAYGLAVHNSTLSRVTGDGFLVYKKTGANYTGITCEDGTWTDNTYDKSLEELKSMSNVYVIGTVTNTTTYTVTFDVQGHGTAPANQSIEKGGKVTKPSDLTATGYTFGGWYKEASCKNAWDFATDTVTADTTLYAKWEKTCTVSGNVHNDDDESIQGAEVSFVPDGESEISATTDTDGNYSLEVPQSKKGTFTVSKDGYKTSTSTKTFTGDTTGVDVELEVLSKYKVTCTASTHGTVSVNKTSATAGETITITEIPSKGYVPDTLTATDAHGNPVEITSNTFTMPAADVTVSAMFIAAKDISNCTIAPIANKIYTGSAITPYDLMVTDGSVTLTKDTDYTVTCENNTNAGTATVTITGAGKYTGTKNANFTISPKQLTVTGSSADGKTYDGTTAAAAYVGTVSGKIGSDDVTVTIASAAFADKNVGNGKDVTIKYSLTGTQAGNYAAPDDSTATADIERRALTVTGTTAGKTYDGSTTVTVTKGTVSGIFEGEDVTVTAATTDTFDNKNAGTSKDITVTYSLSGNDENNYAKPLDEIVAAAITAKAINVTADNKTSKIGADLVALTYTADDLISGDSFTGELATNADKTKAGTYEITQGTLTAGDNYSVNFTKGIYTVTESKTDPAPEPSGSSSGTWTSAPTLYGSVSAPINNGTWSGSATGTWQYKVNGETLKNATAWISYTGADGKPYTGCFYFDKKGNMAIGWQKIDNIWYFFDTTPGSAFGIMKTAVWITTDGKQYYVGADGKMLADTTTPDGHKVDATGARID